MDDSIRELIDKANDRMKMLSREEEDYPAWIVDYDFLERGLVQGVRWYEAENDEKREALKQDTWAYGVLTGSAAENRAELKKLAKLDKRTIFIVFFDYIFDETSEDQMNFDTVIPLKRMKELGSMGFGSGRRVAVHLFFRSLPQDYQLVNMPYFNISWTLDCGE